MADEENTIVEGEGADNDKPKKKSPIIMFAGIGVGAVILGVVLTMFVIMPMMGGDDSGQGEEVAQEESHEQSDDGHGGGHDDGHGEEADDHDGGHGGGHGGGGDALIYTIGDIVVNPAGTGGSRFLSASISFELESSEVYGSFEAKDAIVRDALITILSSKTVTQLTDPKQKEIVRYQIKRRVAKLMKTDQVAGVYYTDFVLQ